MGRSAKFHKRTKKTSAPTTPTGHPATKPSSAAPSAQEQKKRAGLKAKIVKHRKEGDGPVLGGADYVDLMFGGRRKAMEEAAKLPRDDR